MKPYNKLKTMFSSRLLHSPGNQYQLALHYLYFYKDISLKDVINDSMFIKFQTRLSEIETKECAKIATRSSVKFKNRFGNKSDYYIYSAIDRRKIKELFFKYK